MKRFHDRFLGRGDAPVDRRRSPRYPSVANRACLVWQQRGRPRESTATLINLSSVGAYVLSDEMPTRAQSVWVRLEGPTPTEWVVARVVRGAGSRNVGLDFAEHCPYDFFKAATQVVQRAVPVPPGFADGYWR
jgi:hypothetical protein